MGEEREEEESGERKEEERKGIRMIKGGGKGREWDGRVGRMGGEEGRVRVKGGGRKKGRDKEKKEEERS